MSESEHSFIIRIENRATIHGFGAARSGKPKESNPFNNKPWSRYQREAWDHGWGCWHERLLPYALEQDYHLVGNFVRVAEVREQFKNTGELPLDLLGKIQRVSLFVW